MMRLPFVLMLVGCAFLGACGGADVADKPEGEAVANVAEQPEKIETPWKLAIEAKRNAGAKIQEDDPNGFGDTKTLEAAGNWLVVMVSVENGASQKQSAKNVFATGMTKLVDANGKEYDADGDAVRAYAQEESVLDKKPFAPGESRSLKFIFDVPKDANPKHIKLVGDDAKGEVQDFIVKF